MVPLAVNAKAVLAGQAEKVFWLVLHVADITQGAAFLNGVSLLVDEFLVKIVKERTTLFDYIVLFLLQ